MGVISSGRVEIPNGIAVDFEFNCQRHIYGFQIHTTVAMQIHGQGFSPETGVASQNSDAIVLRRPGVAVVQTDYTEVDGVFYVNTAPIPFYLKAGTHKIHVLNASGGAGYITILCITGNNYR